MAAFTYSVDGTNASATTTFFIAYGSTGTQSYTDWIEVDPPGYWDDYLLSNLDECVITITEIPKPKAPPPPIEIVLKPPRQSSQFLPRRVCPRSREGGIGTRNWHSR